jgi:diketogulonate reductase-like aldo/keto reductase
MYLKSKQIEYHAYTAKSAQPLLELHHKHGIITEAFGGLTPIVRNKGGPVDPILSKIRQRLAETSGNNSITEGQVILKWLEAKEIVAVT